MYDNFTVAYEGYNENLDLISFCMTHWIFESKRSKKASLALNMERTGSWSRLIKVSIDLYLFAKLQNADGQGTACG